MKTVTVTGTQSVFRKDRQIESGSSYTCIQNWSSQVKREDILIGKVIN
jgi:hypothetical protein